MRCGSTGVTLSMPITPTAVCSWVPSLANGIGQRLKTSEISPEAMPRSTRMLNTLPSLERPGGASAGSGCGGVEAVVTHRVMIFCCATDSSGHGGDPEHAAGMPERCQIAAGALPVYVSCGAFAL